jgi:CRP-like cAMP-binding protein
MRRRCVPRARRHGRDDADRGGRVWVCNVRRLVESRDVFKNGKLIRTLGPGDVFGEIAVFFGGVPTATVVARTPMKLVMLFTGELTRLDRELPEVADKFRGMVADRLGVA